MSLPPHLVALRDAALATSCESWALRKRWKLGPGHDRAGPCPVCGGTDRFAIHTGKNTFNCRRCEISGHGVIDLVMKTENVDFTKACEIITGRSASEPVDAAKAAEMRRRNEFEAAERAVEAERYREQARKSAYGIWRDGAAVDWTAALPSPVALYLERRGIRLDFLGHQLVKGTAIQLRESYRLRWREKRGNVWVIVHEGSAMLAAVQRPDGSFGAVHQTWLDPALCAPRSGEDANRLGGPGKGKLVLPPDAEGRERPSKKVLGVKKGGAIRLFTPPGTPVGSTWLGRAESGTPPLPASGQDLRGDGPVKGPSGREAVAPLTGPSPRDSAGARRIVMGEGIETTLTALAHNFEPDTAYWAGVDLGNMAGRALRAHVGDEAVGNFLPLAPAASLGSGPGQPPTADRSGARMIHDQPDMSDLDCFLPPDWCEELVFLCDSDEAANHTEDKVIRGLRRALRVRAARRAENPALPVLVVAYVPAPGDGQDLNDLVRVDMGSPERLGLATEGCEEQSVGKKE